MESSLDGKKLFITISIIKITEKTVRFASLCLLFKSIHLSLNAPLIVIQMQESALHLEIDLTQSSKLDVLIHMRRERGRP